MQELSQTYTLIQITDLLYSLRKENKQEQHKEKKQDNGRKKF